MHTKYMQNYFTVRKCRKKSGRRRGWSEITAERSEAFPGFGGVYASGKPVQKLAIDVHGFGEIAQLALVDLACAEEGVVGQDVVTIIGDDFLQQVYGFQKFALLESDIRFQPVYVVQNGGQLARGPYLYQCGVAPRLKGWTVHG